MKCEFHPQAEVDLLETTLYYETQVPGLGEKFAAEVHLAIERLLAHPKIGTPDAEGFRKWVLDTFPYNIRYSESADLIYILVVESQHRNPDYWKSRLGR